RDPRPRSLSRDFFFFSSRRRHTISYGDWSSDVCSSDLDGKLTFVVVVASGDDLKEVMLEPPKVEKLSSNRHYAHSRDGDQAFQRSEERRVGKGGRWWGCGRVAWTAT